MAAAAYADRVYRLRSSPGFIAFGVCVAAFTETFLYGLIIPLLPYTLTERVNIREADVQQWISILLAMYGIGSIIGSALTGYIASRGVPSRIPYSLGLISLAISTLAFALGRDMYVLLIGRTFQGLSSAAVWTAGLVLLNGAVEKEKSGRYMGFVNASAALGYMTGPAAGGFVYDSLGYYSVYGLASLLVLFDIILRIGMLTPDSTERRLISSRDNNTRSRKTPMRTNSLFKGFRDPPQEPINTASIETSPLLPHHKTQRESIRGPSPTLSLLSSPRMLAALLASFAEHLILTGLEAVLPVFTKHRFAWSSSQIALLFLLLVSPTLFSPLVGRYAERYRANRIVGLGLLVAAPAIFCLRFIDDPSSDSSSPSSFSLKVTVEEDVSEAIAGLAVLIGIIGVGVALLMTPVMAEISCIVEEIQDTTPPPEPDLPTTTTTNGTAGTITRSPSRSTMDATPLAYGMVNGVMMGAGIVGPLVCGALVELAGWAAMATTLGLFCGGSAVVVYVYLAPKREGK